MKLFKELQRRNVIRMAIGYIVSSWLLLQVADLVLDVIGAPGWVLQSVALILALGLPVVVFFSWAYEVTPEGIKRESEVDRSQSITHVTGRKLDRAIIAVLVVALGYFIWESRFSGQAEPPPVEEAVVAEEVAQADQPAAKAPPDRSIAVLPFVNMSSDEEQEYFSDGLTEEILNRLAQLPELRVAGRTSSFKYKGQNLDLRDIAAELGVSNILEGSVRRSGDTVRITAQLVRAEDGAHLWSQTYDRSLEHIFAVHDEIAERVAGNMDVLLDDTKREKMRSVGVPSVEAFIAYQKAWEVFVEGHAAEDMFGELEKANALFREAIEWYPGFGDAWYWQADLYQHILLDPGTPVAELEQASARNIEILKLASENAQTPRQKAFSDFSRIIFSDDWTGIRTYYERALDLQTCFGTNWSEVLSPFGVAGLNLREQDTFLACHGGVLRSPLSYTRRVESLLLNGMTSEALEWAEKSIAETGQSDRTSYLRTIALLALGRVEEAAKEAALINTGTAQRSHWPAITQQLLGNTKRADELSREYLEANLYPHRTMALLKYLGRQEELDEMAAALDARPVGHVLLASAHLDCLCGPVFDLDRTPNFKARLEEGQLTWPPETIIDIDELKARAGN